MNFPLNKNYKENQTQQVDQTMGKKGKKLFAKTMLLFPVTLSWWNFTEDKVKEKEYFNYIAKGTNFPFQVLNESGKLNKNTTIIPPYLVSYYSFQSALSQIHRKVGLYN